MGLLEYIFPCCINLFNKRVEETPSFANESIQLTIIPNRKGTFANFEKLPVSLDSTASSIKTVPEKKDYIDKAACFKDYFSMIEFPINKKMTSNQFATMYEKIAESSETIPEVISEYSGTTHQSVENYTHNNPIIPIKESLNSIDKSNTMESSDDTERRPSNTDWN
ncbi:hypothetical protein A3Q56_05456, partial [Intoshia linei]